jgi:hypothetical protein
MAAAAVAFGAAISWAQQTGDPYVWPAYNPTISYNFLTEMPAVNTPTRDTVHRNCNVVGSRSDGWWSFYWGPNRRSNVTDAAIDAMLARMNEEFAYFRDVMGWPPDSRAQRGFRSAIYLFGSGIGCMERADTDTNSLGGWQSSDGFSPVVLLSYYPVASFDPRNTYSDRNFQMGAVIHEGIHSILASMPTARNVPGWFHEGGNTWLQQQADAQRTGVYGNWASLNGPAFMAPFMPIECYSGWLQDGSFGGPNAEGVNRNNPNGQQLCTWRAWLGGTQYGNGFPTFLGEWLNPGSIAWIWMNATNSNDRVLGTIARGLGEEQTRLLIVEYRARQATLDMRRWTDSARRLMSSNFGRNLGPEGNAAGGNWMPNTPTWRATPYAITTNDGTGVLTPDPLTLPGWSGANQIPLTIPASMNTVTVDFMPDTANMVIQLVYRDVDGRAVYSEPVSVAAGQTGQVSLRLDTRPRMGPSSVSASNRSVVIAVITNTDYLYRGDATRHAKYRYRIRIPAGVTAADVNTQWFNVPNMVIDTTSREDNGTVGTVKNARLTPARSTAFNASVDRSGRLRVNYTIASPASVRLDIYNTAGALVRSVPMGRKTAGEYRTELDLRGMGIPSGTYIVRM